MIAAYAIAAQVTDALVPFAIDWHDGRYHLISLTRCQAGCTAAAGYVTSRTNLRSARRATAGAERASRLEATSPANAFLTQFG